LWELWEWEIEGQVLLDRLTELLQIGCGENNNVPTFREAAKLVCEKKQCVVLDVCCQDCCIFFNAPKRCDPNGDRQLEDRQQCPVCGEPRYVLTGPLQGRPRKVIYAFPIAEALRSLFALAGWSKKLNPTYGQPMKSDGEMQVGFFPRRV
jgi:hypothetical protein